MARIALQVAYDGSAYAGFQIQVNAPTVASVLQAALQRLYRESIVLKAAGRTDAGVHARAQYIHFDSPQPNIPLEKLPLALNTFLPEDVRIVRAYAVSPCFHARINAVRRTYVYTLYQGRIVPPHIRHFVVPWRQDYVFERMQADAEKLIGTHDFRAFAQGSENEHTVRTVYQAVFTRDEEYLQFTISANGFLRKMVRSIVGTLCEWEMKRLRGLSLMPIDVVITKRDRSLVGKTAPARGLCLDAVEYEEINTRTSC